MRVTKAILEKSCKGLLKTNGKLQRENRQLKQLLTPNAWLVEPEERASLSVLDTEPAADQFHLGNGYTGGSVLVEKLCRSEMEALIGHTYVPTVDSYTALAIVGIKKWEFLPTLVASQPVLR